jgi:hypothetical protein
MLLREVVSHQLLVPETTVAVNVLSPHHRSSPMIQQLCAVFDLLDVDEEAHHLHVIVLKQLLNV